MMNVSPIGQQERDGGSELPRPTRLALWALLGFSLLMLLILLEYQRKRVELAQAQQQAAASRQLDQSSRKVRGGHATVTPATAPAQSPAAIPLAPQEPLDPAQWSSEMASAELAILRDLSENDWSKEPRRTLKRLAPLLQHTDAQIQDGAQALKNTLDKILNAEARAQARDFAERATELADAGDFVAALKMLESGEAQLPADAPFTTEQAAPIFKGLREDIQRRREAARDALLGPGGPGSLDRARALLDHIDPMVREEAARRVKATDDLIARLKQARTDNTRKSHEAWQRFISAYRTAMLEGNAKDAEDYCAKPLSEDLAFLLGTYPNALKGMQADAANLRKLQDAALKIPADKRAVDLPLRRGRVTGTLEGTRRGQLSVALEGGAFVSVKVEALSAAGFLQLFGDKWLAENNLRPAIWALSALENPADAPSFLAKNYAQLNQPVPDQWKLFFAVESQRVAEQKALEGFKELDDAVKSADPERAAKALDDLQPALGTLRQFGGLSDERETLLRAAQKLAGKLQARTVILQTGVLPSPAFKGLVTDQISQYLDNQNKTDVGAQFGIKLGAHGGLQRVLLKLDGIETVIGKARVKTATLELYQIDSPKSNNAAIGLFRLKRAWVPDAGTWRAFSDAKNALWAVPGAAGEDDITNGEDASVTLDAKKNTWRAFDITRYVQDILKGKWQNNGFLLKVTNGEPDYHVRFYPETDVDQMKDPKLRPKLTLELEVDE